MDNWVEVEVKGVHHSNRNYRDIEILGNWDIAGNPIKSEIRIGEIRKAFCFAKGILTFNASFFGFQSFGLRNSDFVLLFGYWFLKFGF